MIPEEVKFIPCLPGQMQLVRGQNLVNNVVSGRVLYEPQDGHVVFSEDVTVTKNISHVDMRLVVSDMSRYSDYDQLPVPASVVQQAITECVQFFSNQQPQNEKGDSTAEPQ